VPDVGRLPGVPVLRDVNDRLTGVHVGANQSWRSVTSLPLPDVCCPSNRLMRSRHSFRSQLSGTEDEDKASVVVVVVLLTNCYASALCVSRSCIRAYVSCQMFYTSICVMRLDSSHFIAYQRDSLPNKHWDQHKLASFYIFLNIKTFIALLYTASFHVKCVSRFDNNTKRCRSIHTHTTIGQWMTFDPSDMCPWGYT